MRLFVRRKWKLLTAGALVLAMFGAAVYLYEWRRALKMGRTTAPEPGIAVSKDPRTGERLAALLEGRKGFAVWSSNRFGNHDIVMMSFPDGTLRRLTTHPHAEYFPRISPDGRRILFVRSQRPWVSHRDPAAWDVYMLDLASGEEQLIAQNANTPTWSASGETVYYQSQIYQFIEQDLKTGKRRQVLGSGYGLVPPDTELQTPNANPRTGDVAVTFRRGRRMTVVVPVDGSELRRIGDGCQITWSPGGDFLYWVDHGGAMQNMIYRYDPREGKPVGWLDLPRPYSHEYFPKLSDDGRYMILGASSGGHEHDAADYEIFVWKVGTAPTDAVRISYHTGNDNWPDLYLFPDR